jgi:hypothetical protein
MMRNNRRNHFLQKADSLSCQAPLFVSVYLKINQKISEYIISKSINSINNGNGGDADATSTDAYIAPMGLHAPLKDDHMSTRSSLAAKSNAEAAG